MLYPLSKREKILVAGVELFASHGFENTTVPRIAKNARVGLNTFYKYFSNKEQLANEIYRDLRRELENALEAAIYERASPRAQFHDLWLAMVGFNRKYPMVISFLENRHHGAYLDEGSEPLEHVPQPIRDLMDRLRQGKVAKNAPSIVLAAIVWGTFAELVKLHSQHRVSFSSEELQAAEDGTWDAIRIAS